MGSSYFANETFALRKYHYSNSSKQNVKAFKVVVIYLQFFLLKNYNIKAHFILHTTELSQKFFIVVACVQIFAKIIYVFMTKCVGGL
jgi:hypothetical protein